MHVIKKIFIVFFLITVALPEAYSFVYSAINHAYIQEREEYLVEESNQIGRRISKYTTSVGESMIRRKITRIISTAYQYGEERSEMESRLDYIMKERSWNLEKKLIIKQNDEEKKIFKKNGYECEITFFLDRRVVRIIFRTDDVYKNLAM